jgi:hypothetical protein
MKLFLSSTFLDLREHRVATAQALERLGQGLSRMEVFNARPQEPRSASLEEVQSSDALVGVYAHRYGFVPKGSTTSITEQELRYAITHGKPVFCFVVDETHPWPPKWIDEGQDRAKLNRLKDFVSEHYTVERFTTADDLALKVSASLGGFLLRSTGGTSASPMLLQQRASLHEALDAIIRTAPHPSGFPSPVSSAVAERVNELLRECSELAAGRLRYSGSSCQDKYLEIITNARECGFTATVVRLTQGWDSDRRTLVRCREAASRGVVVKRVFILNDKQALLNRSLREQLARDKLAGIALFLVFADELRDPSLIKDAELWDDNYALTWFNSSQETSSSTLIITQAAADLRRARSWKKRLLAVSASAETVLASVGLGEMHDQKRRPDATLPVPARDTLLTDLAASAPLQRENAKRHCAGGYLDDRSCEWYHGPWQYLRLLGMVMTPDVHADFFHCELKAALRSGPRRILICGAADYAMLSHVSFASAAEGGIHETTVVDICPTPLLSCAWYAQRYNLAINTIRSDVFDSQFRDGSFDVVATDAMLTRFSRLQRAALVSEWGRVNNWRNTRHDSACGPRCGAGPAQRGADSVLRGEGTGPRIVTRTRHQLGCARANGDALRKEHGKHAVSRRSGHKDALRPVADACDTDHNSRKI